MERFEYEVLSEVSRVVDNYNAVIAESSTYDGSGEITLTETPDDLEESIDNVVAIMQCQKVELEKVGESDLAAEVNNCVLQVHDLKSQIP